MAGSPSADFFHRPLSKRGIVIATFCVLGICALLITGAAPTSDDKPQTATAAKSSSDVQVQKPVENREPPLADVTLHPYDLLKDPFSYKNRAVTLNFMERPVLYNGALVQYANIGSADPRMAANYGLLGLRSNRMLSPSLALYDILGVNANHQSGSELLGQLAVVLPDNRGTLEMSRYWEVEPLGVLDGTNGFGAAIQIPQVRFWQYTDERNQSFNDSNDRNDPFDLLRQDALLDQQRLQIQLQGKQPSLELLMAIGKLDSQIKSLLIQRAINALNRDFQVLMPDTNQASNWDFNITEKSPDCDDRCFTFHYLPQGLGCDVIVRFAKDPAQDKPWLAGEDACFKPRTMPQQSFARD